jgi:hypothetical protein
MEDAKEFMTSVMLHTRMMETANDPDVRKQFGDGMNIVIAGMPHEAPPDPEGSDRPEGQPEAPGAAPA